jgi:hypothetical protein
MLLSPVKELNLRVPQTDLRATRDGRQFLLRLPPDRFRVLDADLNLQREFTAGEGAWEISPDGTMLVLVHEMLLSVMHLDGHLLYDEQSTWRPGPLFDDFQFTTDQRFLWTVQHVWENQIALEVRDTTTWQVLREVVFPEPAPPASVSLHPHPEGRIMAVWAASGQDGQWVYWAYDDGQAIQVYEVPELTEPVLPSSIRQVVSS